MEVSPALQRGIPSVEWLRDEIEYDAKTGEFWWKKRKKGKRQYDVPAGTLTVNGRYVSIGINQKPYYAHILAWFWTYGEWPNGKIDHINGVGTDNRLENLRVVSHRVNMQNQRAARVDNTTGAKVPGIEKNHNGFRVRLYSGANGERESFGTYATVEEAEKVALEARRKRYEGNTL
jgi:hypothetical protein